MKNQPEFHLQKQICQYLSLAYPKVLFLSDTVASVKLTQPQQQRNKAIQKSDFKCPDLIVLHPNKYFHGLMIELKVESPFKKDGTIYASQNDHLLKQHETLKKLSQLGYWAGFLWSFESAKNIIDLYMADSPQLKQAI